MENFDDRGNPHEDTRAARYPEGQGDPLPSTPDRPFTKRLGRLALPLLLIALTGFTAYNTLSVTGALRATFPNTQVFSIGVAYSFANSAGQVLLPGGQGNVTLTIQSAVSQPVTLFLSYNATDPNDWSSDSSNTGQSGGFNGPLTMSRGSVSRLAPVHEGVERTAQTTFDRLNQRKSPRWHPSAQSLRSARPGDIPSVNLSILPVLDG